MKLKDKKIEILEATYTMDKEGNSIETLTPIAPPVWAYFRHLSGKEIQEARNVKSLEEVQFVINWRDDISTYHVIRYKGGLYDITHIDTFEGYKGDLKLHCKSRGN